ncbi:MAG: enoyl-CoA hydratase/isomerase family protein [Lachnospiraceae bacterium]
MEYQNIIYSVSEGIATIRLNRPQALNALNSAVNRDIMSAIEEIKNDSEVRVVIVTGSEKALAAGADVKEMAEATPRFARDFCKPAIDINDTLEGLHVPVIAAVGGFAFGGGCELALACDFRVGGPRTLMSFPEVGLGIIPGANGCERAAAILGPAKAKQLVMLTEMIPGKQAYELGLLNWFVKGDEALDEAAAKSKAELKAAKKEGNEEKIAALKAESKETESAAAKAEYDAIYAKAVEIAKMLSSKPACALAAAKAVINKAVTETVAAGKQLETAEFALLFNTHDQKEGMAAMIEKRKPEFTNN